MKGTFQLAIAPAVVTGWASIGLAQCPPTSGPAPGERCDPVSMPNAKLIVGVQNQPAFWLGQCFAGHNVRSDMHFLPRPFLCRWKRSHVHEQDPDGG